MLHFALNMDRKGEIIMAKTTNFPQLMKCPACNNTVIAIRMRASTNLSGNEEMQFQDEEPTCICKTCGYSWFKYSKTPIQ